MATHINGKFNEGMIAFANENFGSCIDTLTEVIKEDSSHKLAVAARGAAHMRSGNPTEALSDFNRALDIDPDYARGYHLRGLAREVQGDDDGALADFSRAIKLAPEYGAAYNSRANLYVKMGRTEEANDDMQMVTHFTESNLQSFANENNVWRSRHLEVEDAMETELNR